MNMSFTIRDVNGKDVSEERRWLIPACGDGMIAYVEDGDYCGGGMVTAHANLPEIADCLVKENQELKDLLRVAHEDATRLAAHLVKALIV